MEQKETPRTRAQELRKNATKEENHLRYDFLRTYPVQFLRQKPFGPYIVDFYCHKAKLAIELDGSQHYEGNGPEQDKIRTAYLQEVEKIRVLRFANLEIKQNFEGVCAAIDRQELTGVITALEALKEPCEVELYSDSKYVIDALQKGWAKGWRARGWIKSDKKPALNPDLWERLLALCERHTVRLHWVKGHADNPHNNRCDELAVAESRKYK